MAKRARTKTGRFKKGKTSAAARRSKAKKLARGKSKIAQLARRGGYASIAAFVKSVPACGKWSVRRRKSTRASPCR